MHLLRKAAHIVVGLDLGGDARDACRLDNVRINGALGQPSGIFNGLGIFVEGLHEEPSDNLSLCLGLGYSGKFPEEVRRGVRTDHVEAHVLIGMHHILVLVFPEESVVHENAGEVVPYGLVEENSGYGRIHAAAESENDLVVAELAAELLHSCFNE